MTATPSDGRVPSTPDSIAVVGCGYVGLVTAVGLAEQGLRVRAYDRDSVRVEACRRLEFPMLEPGLVEAAAAAGDRLSFHDVGDERWTRASFTFLAVPTPGGDRGAPDLSMLREALLWVADGHEPLSADNVIVIRSTVPPGTARWAAGEVERQLGSQVPVVANPEFLQEGRALADFRQPSRVLIGSDDPDAAERLRRLMAFTDAPVLVTDSATAELAKYGSNAFLAMRISFANELARLAEREGADALFALRAVGMDPRIGPRYLQPGLGYGGSCLPKDVAALVSMGTAVDEPMTLMRATQDVNERQRGGILDLLGGRLGGLDGRRIAVLGLAFKPGTNDVRESPGLQLVQELAEAGATVTAWDPAVGPALLDVSIPSFTHATDPWAALADADAAILATEWPEAVGLDLDRAAAVMRGRLLVDGRYGWDHERAADAGLELVRIGSRGPARPVRSVAAPATP